MTKRWGAVLAAAILLAACGGDDDAAPATTGRPGPAEAPAPTTTGTRTEPPATGGTEPEPSATTPPTVVTPIATAPPADAEATPTHGGHLVVATESPWTPIDPRVLATVTDRSVANAVYDTLVSFNADGTFGPMLATSWTVDETGTAYVFELRDGVTFHDGTPFDAAAVVAHLDRLRDPANGCRCLDSLNRVAAVEATGPLQVTITLTEPYAPLIGLLSDTVGMIPSPTAVAAAGADYGVEPVGTGPFVFVEQVAGDRIEFARNPDYWDGDKPYLDQLTFRAMPEGQARYAAVRAGDVDLVMNPRPADIVAARDEDGLQTIDVGGLGTRFILFQTGTEPFTDVRARRAVAHATDVDTLIETLFEGTVSATTTPFTDQMWAQSSPSTYPTYDLDEARRLVDELGGLSFTFNIDNRPETIELAQALQGMWREAGIEAEIEPLEELDNGTRVLERNFQASLFRWAGRADPDENVYRFFRSDGGVNWTGINDPELDAALDAGRTGLTHEERVAAYATVAEKLGEHVPYLFVHALNGTYITTDEVHGVPPVADWRLRTADIWLDS